MEILIMKIKFKTNQSGIKITTYQPENIKYEYEGKLYRVEIYIEEPDENKKAKNGRISTSILLLFQVIPPLVLYLVVV